MRMLTLLFGLSVTAASSAIVARSPDAPASEEVWISNLSANPATCNLRVAKKVSFANIVGDPQSWLGKCVAVEGYWKGRTLFVSKPAASARNASALGDQLGLYGRDVLLDAEPKHARAYTAVGMMGDCKRLWDASVMVLGYCHYRLSGPY